MTNQLLKYILGSLKVLIVYIVLSNILMPDAASFLGRLFPSLVSPSIVSWSEDKFNQDLEDEKDIEDDKENEKEKEIDKSFFTEQKYLNPVFSIELNTSKKHFLERRYPRQIFPITTPPPRYI